MKIAHKIETYTSDGEPVLRFTVMYGAQNETYIED